MSVCPSFFIHFFPLCPSPGEQQIGHLITHDPPGSAVAERGEMGWIKYGGEGQQEGEGLDCTSFLCYYYYFFHFLLAFPHHPCCIPPLHYSPSSLRQRWQCLCICNIKSTAVPWLLARVNPAHSHLKTKWPIYMQPNYWTVIWTCVMGKWTGDWLPKICIKSHCDGPPE